MIILLMAKAVFDYFENTIAHKRLRVLYLSFLGDNDQALRRL